MVICLESITLQPLLIKHDKFVNLFKKCISRRLPIYTEMIDNIRRELYLVVNFFKQQIGRRYEVAQTFFRL